MKGETLQKLQEKRDKLFEENKDLLNSKDDAEQWSEEEKKGFADRKNKILSLDEQIKSIEEFIGLKGREEGGEQIVKDPDGEAKEFARMAKRFDLHRAVKTLGAKRSLDGVEREISDMGEADIKAAGEDASGNLHIPYNLLDFGSNTKAFEKRDVTDTGEGADLVATEVSADVIPVLAPRLVFSEMGAMFLRGLTSDLLIPRGNGKAAMAWEGENDANAETTPTYNNITFTPKRVGGFIDLSKQLVIQSTPDIQTIIRRELERAIAAEWEAKAIDGGGTNEPNGILDLSGAGDVNLGANGAAPTWSTYVNLEKEVSKDDAFGANNFYLTNPDVVGKSKTVEKATNTGLFLIADNTVTVNGQAGIANGYPVFHTSNVPNGLTKGTGTNLSALIFGSFSELVLAQFGGIDLLVDNVTQGTSALIRIIINMWVDVNARHDESFAFSDEVATT